MSCAARPSICQRSSIFTTWPSRNSAIAGDDGRYPGRYSSRTRAVASRSFPANTVIIFSGRTSCSRARATAGRAIPAAHPQTELTTTSTVPFFSPSTASTSSAVRVSSIPRRVSSARIGATICSSYIWQSPIEHDNPLVRLILIDAHRADHLIEHVAVTAGLRLRSHEQEIDEMFVGDLARDDRDPFVNAGVRIGPPKSSRECRASGHAHPLPLVAHELEIWAASLNLSQQIIRRIGQRDIAAVADVASAAPKLGAAHVPERIVVIDDCAVDDFVLTLHIA